MHLVSYNNGSHDQLAILINGYLYNMDELHPDLPGSMSMFLNYWEDAFPLAKRGEEGVKSGRFLQNRGVPFLEDSLLSPVPFPTSLRKSMAFRSHAIAVCRSFDMPLPKAYDYFPPVYFCNHHNIQGAGEIACMPDHLVNLDFELGVAAVICRHGRNIPASHADTYIGGLMIMNSISARIVSPELLQQDSGAAFGMQVATATGPALITLDELESFEIPARINHTGKCWNLPMRCSINGTPISAGNLGEMDWTFAELIEQASYGADLYPGDLIGSGAAGTGCFLELNAAAGLNNPARNGQWLNAFDKIKMEIDGMGVLNNQIVPDESNWSRINPEK